MILSKCRRVVLALIAPVVMLSPLTAWSLGMGEIEVDSALNEKFDAAIQLSDARELQDSEIVVSLASREDFDRVGVERFHFLTTLQFEVDFSGRDPVVRLSSNQPISEPYLNFIVEVLWPNGRLLKEFTVLLDPPTFSAAAAPEVAAPVESPAERTSTPAREPRQAPTRVALDRQPASAVATRASVDGEILTTRDDTLWKIANRTRGDGVDVNQQMLAIQELNPQAFIRNNINLLKAGYRLTLPTENQALGLSSQDARVAVADQANAWRRPVAQSTQDVNPGTQNDDTLQSQVDATADEPQQVVEVQSDEGQVRIVAAGGDLVQGTSEQASAESARLLEENETLSRQVDELQYQLDREKELAANQVELRARELEVKDQELAALQARLEALEQESDEGRQNQVTPTQPADVPIWQSPLVLGGVIGVLVLLLAFVLIRNRRSEDEYEYDDDYDVEYDQPESAGEEVSSIEPMISSDSDDATVLAATDEVPESEDVVADLEPADEFEEAAETGMPTGGAGTSDVIGEADIYVAYGRHGQAITLLKGALDKEPDRHDVRLKLLEVCVEAEDPGQFSEHADYLIENCDDEDILMACRELEGRLNEQVATLEDLDGSDDDPEDEGDALPAAADDDDGALSIDDTSVTELAQTEVQADESEDFELEFDLDDATDAPGDEPGSDESDSADSTVALGGDLGMEFDPDVDSEKTETEIEIEPDAEFDLTELDALEAAEDAQNNPTEAVTQDESQDAPVEQKDEDLGDFDFDAEGDSDINATKIDLAEAYIDMGDGDGARDILGEVLEEGSSEQKARAQELLDSIG